MVIDIVFAESVISALIKEYEDLESTEYDEYYERAYSSILSTLYDIQEDLEDGRLFKNKKGEKNETN